MRFNYSSNYSGSVFYVQNSAVPKGGFSVQGVIPLPSHPTTPITMSENNNTYILMVVVY